MLSQVVGNLACDSQDDAVSTELFCVMGLHTVPPCLLFVFPLPGLDRIRPFLPSILQNYLVNTIKKIFSELLSNMELTQLSIELGKGGDESRNKPAPIKGSFPLDQHNLLRATNF